MKRAFAVLCAAVAGVFCVQTSALAQADPYQIFARARNVWAAQRYPAYLTYTVAVTVVERGVTKSKHYHLAYAAQQNHIVVNAVSDEELAAPPTPSGFIFHLQPRRKNRVLFDKKVGNPGEAVDYLGVPMIAPTYSFGMSSSIHENGSTNSAALVQQIRKQFNDPMSAAKLQQASALGGLKAIASVTSTVRNYDVALASIDAIGGRQCYHLLLTPTHDPGRFRLRELWVDTQTYQTLQLKSAGNFTGSPVPWLITFDDVGGSMYIASEVALAPVGVGSHRFEHASVAFQDIAPSSRPAELTSTFLTKEAIMAEPGSNEH